MWILKCTRIIVCNRRRINLLHRMAVLTSVSFLIILCVLTLVTSPVQPSFLSSLTKRSEDENAQQSNDRLDQPQRHHRVLQFMNSKDYDRESGAGGGFVMEAAGVTGSDRIVTENPKIDIKLQHSANMFQGTDTDGSLVVQMNAAEKLSWDDFTQYKNSHIPSLDSLDDYGLKMSNKAIDDFVDVNWKTPKHTNFDKQKRRYNSDVSGGVSYSNKKATFASQTMQYKTKTPKPSRNASHRNTSEVPIRRLPQAIIFGIKKSGTRALLEFLRIHPDVEGTGPEPHYFDRNYHMGLDWYRSLMPKTYEGQITIEKTPSYFITSDAPQRILHMNPEVKLILVVRDPVTRAISDYCQSASKKENLPSFEEMAILDERRGLVNTSWSAIKIGVYHKHMEKWLRVFPRKQIHLVDGQALITQPAKVLAKVEQFLSLPAFINEKHFSLNHFKGSFPCMIRNGKTHCLDERNKGRDHPKVKQRVIKKLREFFTPLNAKFYQMVRHDFGW